MAMVAAEAGAGEAGAASGAGSGRILTGPTDASAKTTEARIRGGPRNTAPAGSKIGDALAAAGAPTQPPGAGSAPSTRPRRTSNGQVRGSTGRPARPARRSATPRRTRSALPRGVSFRDPRKIVLAEFLACVVIVSLSTFAKSDPKKATEGTLVQYSALCAVFFTLSLMTGGKRSGNVAAAFGLLVTLAIVFNNRKAFAEIAGFFKTQHSIAEGLGKGAAAGMPGGIAAGLGAGAAAGMPGGIAVGLGKGAAAGLGSSTDELADGSSSTDEMRGA